jgi:hypothetical protein
MVSQSYAEIASPSTVRWWKREPTFSSKTIGGRCFLQYDSTDLKPRPLWHEPSITLPGVVVSGLMLTHGKPATRIST